MRYWADDFTILSARGLLSGHNYEFPLVRQHSMRNGADKPVTGLWHFFTGRPAEDPALAQPLRC
jgi:hypothetical protein